MSAAPFSRNLLRIDSTPLVSAFVGNKAVAFVGAGASIPSGMPSWMSFLTQSLQRAQSTCPTSGQWERASRFLAESDYLTTAELLQRGLGTQLEQYVWDAFGGPAEPSHIHHAIARLPFSLVITTNFDRLLEAAYSSYPSVWTSPPGVRTWRDPEAIFSAIRRRRFTIIKTHGDVGNGPSIVLTKSQYRDLTRLNKAFSFCLKTLLSLRTFLFIGFSLRDPDISALMDDARLLFGDDFGPHYAILFEDEVDTLFAEYLKHAYNINILTAPSPPESLKESEIMCFREQSVANILNQLGGMVAKEKQKTLPPPSLDDPLFNRKTVCDRLLRTALSLTGSSRGEACLIQTEGYDHIIKTTVLPPAISPPTSDVSSPLIFPANDDPYSILPSSVIGRLFLKRKATEDFIYISDTSHSRQELTLQGFADATYKTCDTSVRSELAVPIFSDGRRVGILNIESSQPNAYTQSHLDALRGIADQIGWAYYETMQRVTSSTRGKRFAEQPAVLHAILTRSRSWIPRHMSFILYSIDPIHGQLDGWFDSSRLPTTTVTPPVRYSFDEPSLASLVLRRRQRVFIRDAAREVALPEGASRLSRKGCEDFGIRGPVFGMPVVSSGNTSAVLVGWTSRLANDPGDPEGTVSEGTLFQECSRFAERMCRLTQMVAVDSEDSTSIDSPFLRALDEAITPIDKGKPWSVVELKKNGNKRRLLLRALLSSLLEASVGLLRVRLWIRSGTTGANTFEIVSSVSRDEARGGKPAWDAYANVGITTSASDAFCQYTLERFSFDPYARHQYSAMFESKERPSVPDVNCDSLDKDPDGAWIVAPIVTLDSWCARTYPGESIPIETDDVADRDGKTTPPVELLGFISADCHCPTEVIGSDGKKTIKPVDKHERSQVVRGARHRFAMDVVSDLIEPILIAMSTSARRSARVRHI
jgi:hypothetical protein